MSFLEQLSDDQTSLIVALPYRAGLYISQSDQSGGDESDEEEAQVLADLIAGYAAEVFGAETVQYVLSETLKAKDEWGAWGEDLDHVLEECSRAIDILDEFVDPKEVSAFKQHILEIGESVALAFREVDEEMSFFQQIPFRKAYAKSKKMAAKKGMAFMSFEQFLNISMDERKALQELAQALGSTYI